MYPHRIRLRGPWTCEPLYWLMTGGQRSAADLPGPFRMTMPGRWIDGGLRDFRGGVRCTRPFGYPGRIDDFERVWLTFADLEGVATVTLNQQVLGKIDGPAAFDITTLLRPHNVLSVDIDSPEPTGGLWGEVALEIRATAFLRAVSIECQGQTLTARGQVVGEAARPLDLYLFAGGRFLVHQLTEAAGAGQPFTLVGDLGGQDWPASLPVRVELVDAATIWYAVHAVVELPQTKERSGSS